MKKNTENTKTTKVAKVDAYNNLPKNDLSAFKKQYNSLENTMLSLAEKAYNLKNKDENQFITYCIKEMNISKGTISKFITAGRISVECGQLVELPKKYTAVYELNKVASEITDFNDYFEDTTKSKLKEASVRQLQKSVNAYLSDGIEDTENIDDTEEKDEVITEDGNNIENNKNRTLIEALTMLKECIEKDEKEDALTLVGGLIDTVANL